MKIFILLLLSVVFMFSTNAFKRYLKTHHCSRISHLRRVTSLSLTPVTSIDVPFNLLKSSQLIAIAADYATEIENAVGVEIYEPIFKAGIFIFFSGVVSSLIVAFIVSKSNAWEGLEDEFQKGKEAQFITLMGSPEGEIRDSIQINESKDEGITTVATTKSNEDGSSSSNIDLRNLDI